jgi:formylglycine-generating enzyme required for sulfatase activity
MHGNVRNWCQEADKDYQVKKDQATEDEDNDLSIDYRPNRGHRGGNFGAEEWNVRSADRVGVKPAGVHIGGGIRPARTFR